MTGSTFMANQPRQPAGVPAGGEFTGRQRESGNVDLSQLDDADYNAQGSYAFPPPPRTAEQHISFWSTVPIPDDVLSNVQRTYKTNREERGAQLAAEAAELWKVDNPDPTALDGSAKRHYGKRYSGDSPEAAEWTANALRVFDAEEERLKGVWPTGMHEMDVRNIVRSYKMDRYSSELSEEEKQKIYAYEFDFGGGHHPTVRQLNDKYRLWEIDDATRTTSTDALLNQLVERLGFIQQQQDWQQ